MFEVIDIVEETQKRTKKYRQVTLDAQASYTAMEQCLNILEMNSLPELRAIKSMMRRTMKDMVEIGKYGKK